MLYRFFEIDFSIFKDKNKTMELFSPDDSIHKIIFLHYTLFEIVTLIEVPKKGMKYFYSGKDCLFPLDIDNNTASIYANILKKPYIPLSYPINSLLAKQIVKDEIKFFNLKIKDIPQQFLPTNNFQSKNMPNKYQKDITNMNLRTEFYDKFSVSAIKKFYQLLETHNIEKFIEISTVTDFLNPENFYPAYEKHLENNLFHKMLASEFSSKNLSSESRQFIESLYDLILTILRSIRIRRDNVLEKLNLLFKEVTIYQWKYTNVDLRDMKINEDSILYEIMPKFGGIYNYKNRQYDYENIWDKRELNDDGSVKMSKLESEIQDLFPDGCYPFSEYKQSDNSLIKRLVNNTLPKPMWFPIMRCGKNDWYYLNYEEIKNSPTGQVIRLTDGKIEIVAQNYLIFMEKIMIKKIESVIEKYQNL